MSEDDQLHILVIDDEPQVRELIGQILIPEGNQVFSVSSAEEGLELLPYFTFQVAFLDQNLPGMEGLVLGEYLRKNNPHMQIAMVTGEPGRRMERLSRASDLKYIPKPFRIEDILDVVTAYRDAEELRERKGNVRPHDFAPTFATCWEEVGGRFRSPKLSARVEGLLVEQIRDSVMRMGAHGFDGEDRGVALAGLITARVLGLKLPKTRDGKTLYQFYDELMHESHLRREFLDAEED